MKAIAAFISDIYITHIGTLVILLTILGLYFFIKRPLYAYYLTISTIPFKSFYLWVGTNIELWKLLSALSLLFYWPSLVFRNYKNIKNNRYFHLIIFFVAYAILLTILFLFLVPEGDKHRVVGGYFKNEGRFIYQILFFLITINLVLWPIFVIKDEEQLYKIFKIIATAGLVLTVAGIFQDLSIKLLGFNPFPIHRPTGFDYEGGTLYVEGAASRQRINSLAGEPKHLAIAIIVAFTSILLHRLNGLKIFRYDFAILVAFLLCLVETYSATGYIWYGVVMMVVLFLYSFRVSKNIIALIVASAITLLIAYFSTNGEPAPYIVKTINKTGLEIQDEAVFKYFRDNPFMAISGLGLGNIHFYAVNYLPRGFPLFHDTPFKGNTGFFFLLGDLGLIGLIMIFVIVAGLIKESNRILFNLDKNSLKKYRIVIHFTFVVGTLYLLRHFELFFVSVGLLLYLHNSLLSKKQLSFEKGTRPDYGT